MTTDVDVLNAAMVLTGQPPVESRDDPEAVAAWAAYDSVIRRVLGTYRSLWVISKLGGKWAAQLRSSFAA